METHGITNTNTKVSAVRATIASIKASKNQKYKPFKCKSNGKSIQIKLTGDDDDEKMTTMIMNMMIVQFCSSANARLIGLKVAKAAKNDPGFHFTSDNVKRKTLFHKKLFHTHFQQSNCGIIFESK